MDELQLPEPSAVSFTLPNGLEVIVEEDHSAPVASVQAWVRSGSIHEGRWLGAGLSHLLEHMIFKGTEKRGPQDFARAVQDHGGYINAYTSFDRTVYWIDIPAKGVATAIDLLSDALMNSRLPADEFVKEQEVIRREFAMGFDDPDSVAGKQLFEAAFSEHPLRHPVIGHLAVFDCLTRDDLAGYFHTRYVPNNAFFVVVGDVDADAILAQLTELFAPHPRRPLPDVLIPREPPQLGRRDRHTEFDTELTRLGLAWHTAEITHPDMPSLDLLASVLGGGRSSRLYKRLREELSLVHNIDAWSYTPASAGLFGVDAVLDPGKRDQVEREILEIIRAVQRDGIEAGELEKARRQFLSHQIHSLATMRGKASDLGSNWLYARNLRFSHDYLMAAQHVVPADLQRVARTYFTDSRLTVSSVNPAGTLRKKAAASRGTRTLETIRFELPNGLRLLVREDHRIPTVAMVASFKAGLLAETADTNGLSRLAARMLIKGTRNRTAEQLAGEIEAVGGGIGADSGNNSINISARVLQPDLDLGIDLLSDVLLHASFPEKNLLREKDAQLAGIKADDEEMTSIARNLLRARLFGSHPFGLRNLGTPDTVRALTHADLAAFRDRHIVGRNGVISVFGAVKADEILALVGRKLGQLPAGEPAMEDLPQPVAPLADIEATEIKPKAQAVIMIGYPGTDCFSPDRILLELLDEACSDLGSRLFNRIREEMGLAYFVGSSNLAGLVRGAFTFYVGTDPARIAEVREALAGEIRKLAAEGLDPAELARAKEKLLGAQEIRNQSNDTLAFTCALDELYGLGHARYLDLRREVEAVTPDQVRAAARRYFTQPAVTAIVRP